MAGNSSEFGLRLTLLVLLILVVSCAGFLEGVRKNCLSRQSSVQRCAIKTDSNVNGRFSVGSYKLRMSTQSESKETEEVLDHELTSHHKDEESTETNNDSNTESEVEIQEQNESTDIDPKRQAIRDLEAKLKAELTSAKSMLQKEQSALVSVQEKMFESGKNGYFLVQAQVKDFNRQRDAEQKKRVEDNKRKVVSKVLPLLDSFRSVPDKFVAQTDREKKMHEDFNVLVRSLTIALQKSGYSEFAPEKGELFETLKHEIVAEVEDENDTTSIRIASVSRPGVVDSTGRIVRKAQVAVSKASKEETIPTGHDNAESNYDSDADPTLEVDSD